jgi:hypothetical protein
VSLKIKHFFRFNSSQPYTVRTVFTSKHRDNVAEMARAYVHTFPQDENSFHEVFDGDEQMSITELAKEAPTNLQLADARKAQRANQVHRDRKKGDVSFLRVGSALHGH